ncbi:hypothetical protein WMY93_007140 [Mugilogobius chulae]|uniref:Uncharacterized protein n=1 Tax=Mugilogobius chulae TaxID=88201 RepID=A0AAW0PMQ2_9GOBI
MSNRIQERLYGKKQSDHTPLRKEEQERERKRSSYVPKRRSRSSSESSSGSYKEYKKSHSYSSLKERQETSHYADSQHQMFTSCVCTPSPPLSSDVPQPVPPFPPFNLFPPMIPPNVPPPPPMTMPHPFLPDVRIPSKPQPVNVNAAKANVKKRPRCLQVISTNKKM